MSKAKDFCEKQSKAHGANEECKEVYTFNRCINSFGFLKKVTGDKSSPISSLVKKLPLTCAKFDSECHNVARKEALDVEKACIKKIDAADAIKNLETFRCSEDSRSQITKYFGCDEQFNQKITEFNDNFRCPTPNMDRRYMYVLNHYSRRRTNECTLGLKGWWNRGKFGKKELSPAEKSEEKVMNASNICLEDIANRGQYRVQ